jgi:ABC-type sulfate transport system permease component
VSDEWFLRMRLIVMLLVVAAILGAFAIQVKFLTIMWRWFVDTWMRTQPRWMVWMTLGIATVAAIIGLVLGFRFNWPE